MKITTLCLLYQPPKILLGLKKRGFGQGRWNGFGGKVHSGETIEEAAGREMKEEAGIEIGDLEESGVITFEFQDGEETIEMHIFQAKNFSGKPTESEEMKPQWYSIDNIPFTDMWPDDIYWFPLFLKRKKFVGRFLFDQPGENAKIIEQNLSEVTPT